MLSAGDSIPDVTVWTAPRESVTMAELARERPALFLFYLFDFSAT